jgi:hypothetical protein
MPLRALAPLAGLRVLPTLAGGDVEGGDLFAGCRVTDFRVAAQIANQLDIVDEHTHGLIPSSYPEHLPDTVSNIVLSDASTETAGRSARPRAARLVRARATRATRQRREPKAPSRSEAGMRKAGPNAV